MGVGTQEGTGLANNGIKPTWLQVIALPLDSSMTLGKLLNFFDLCFPISKMGNLIKFCLPYIWCLDLEIFHHFSPTLLVLGLYELP